MRTVDQAEMFGIETTETAPAERHWFVPDDSGMSCLACNLPYANRRHVPRRAGGDRLCAPRARPPIEDPDGGRRGD